MTSPATEGSAPGSFTIGDYAIVFNGDLQPSRPARRAGCGRLDVQDRSDTVTLLVPYLAWGKLLPDVARGMFAFAISDKQRGELFRARDSASNVLHPCRTASGSQFIFAPRSNASWSTPPTNASSTRRWSSTCFQFRRCPRRSSRASTSWSPRTMTVRADG
ncbi:MAG: hypothetical protein ACLT98_10660 [Eggerthellaceae bacterium]